MPGVTASPCERLRSPDVRDVLAFVERTTFWAVQSMADIINLKRARKRAERIAREEEAEHNRIVHGRPIALRRADALRLERESRTLDGHRIEKPEVP